MVRGTVMLARHTAGTTERAVCHISALAAAAVGAAVLVVGRRR